MPMKYIKPALSFAKQADLIINRGLICDKAELIDFLSQSNYYRFSSCLFPFRKQNTENFNSGTTLEVVKRRYYFDSQLRLLIMSAIELIEIAILRTHLVEQFTLIHGPFGCSIRGNFAPTLTHPDFHKRLLDEINANIRRSHEFFVNNYKLKYSSEPYYPMWMIVETMSFGSIVQITRNLHRSEKISLANKYSINHNVLNSWLHSLTYIRNACAHHNRIWNRVLPIKPKIPTVKHKPSFHLPVTIPNDRIFSILTILEYLLKTINFPTIIKTKLLELFKKYPEIPIHKMGFPTNWEQSHIWN